MIVNKGDIKFFFWFIVFVIWVWMFVWIIREFNSPETQARVQEIQEEYEYGEHFRTKEGLECVRIYENISCNWEKYNR